MKTIFIISVLIGLFIQKVLAYESMDTTRVHFYLHQAEQFMIDGEYDSAYKNAMFARSLVNDSMEYFSLGKSIYLAGRARHFQYRLNEALNNFREAYQVLNGKVTEKQMYQLGLYNSLGGVLTDMGKLAEGRKYLEEGLALGMRYSDDNQMDVAKLHFNIGATCIFFRETQLGINHLFKALPVYMREFGSESLRVARIYMSLGSLYNSQLDYVHSIEYYNKAIAIIRKTQGDDFIDLAYAYSGLGGNYLSMKNSDNKAQFYMEKALELCEKYKGKLLLIQAYLYSSIARLETSRGNMKNSYQSIHRSIDIIQEVYGPKSPHMATYVKSLGNIYAEDGNFEKAHECYQKAIQLLKDEYGNIHPGLASYYNSEANVFSKEGKYDKALASLQYGLESITINAVTFDRVQQLILTNDIGKIHLLLAQQSDDPSPHLVNAFNAYKQTSEIIKDLRRGYISDQSKFRMQDMAKKVYDGGITTCFQLYALTKDRKYLDQAFTFFENSKATMLTESMQSIQFTSLKDIPNSVLARENELIRHLKSLEIRANNLEGGSQRSLELNNLSQLLFKAHLTWDSLMQVIKNEYPQYHSLKYEINSVSIRKIQEDQEKDDLLLSYFEGDSVWFVIGISKDQTSFLSVSKSAISTDKIMAYFKSLGNFNTSNDDLGKSSYDIYYELVAPTIKLHKTKENLILVPDGVLTYVPFEALWMSSIGDQYLIDKYAIIYEPSVAVLYTIKSRDESTAIPYLGFAPQYEEDPFSTQATKGVGRQVLKNIKGAQDEVRFGHRLFSGKVFIGMEATKNNFKLNLQPSKIIHLAMHGDIDDKEPMNSKLFFSESDSIEDASLKAYEIYNLDMQSELAILSACNTGSGKIMNGEGKISVARAFMYAGSSSVVMNLWLARDQPTKEIMKYFLENLDQGLTKERALQKAKLKYLEGSDPLKRHPTNWASLVLMGRGEPIRFHNPNKYLYVIIAIALFTVVALMVYYKRRVY